VLAALFTTVLFSISAICGRRTATLLGGTEANFWRLVFATALLAIYAHAFGFGIGTVAFPAFVISGAIGFGIGDASLFQALPRIGSRLSVLLVLCLSSPIAGLIEWAWLGTRLTVPEIVCGAIILLGVAVALSPSERLDWKTRPFLT